MGKHAWLEELFTNPDLPAIAPLKGRAMGVKLARQIRQDWGGGEIFSDIERVN